MTQGNCVLSVRYIYKSLELEKVKATTIVEKSDKLIPKIETLISALNAANLISI